MGQAEDSARDNRVLDEVARAIKSMRYGRIELIVQDSRVIQINKTEKVRFDEGQTPKTTGG